MSALYNKGAFVTLGAVTESSASNEALLAHAAPVGL